MSTLSPARLVSIASHPVKGLPGRTLLDAALMVGKPLPGDRQFALRLPQSKLDPADPTWASKRHFVQAVNRPEMMALDILSDFQLPGDGDKLARAVERATGLEGLVFYGRNGWLTDQSRPRISLINQASVDDLVAKTNQALEVERFRGNLVVSGWAAWAETALNSCELKIGEAVLKVVEPIERCAAPGTSPITGKRDRDMLAELEAHTAARNFGLFLEVVRDGIIRPGDLVEVV